MRVLVTGARGLLGTEICKQVLGNGHELVSCGSELDVSDPEAAARIGALEFGAIDWLVNCAAFTGVDLAESEPQRAYEVNALAPGYLSTASSIAQVKILHISTDFVFDGEASEPYSEEASPRPLGVYGRTKRDGELALTGNYRAVVVRTSWLFGPSGKCFPRSILTAFDAGKSLRVVSDQWGTPTYTPFLAQRLVEVIERDPFPGIYHLAGSEVVSWFELAQQTIETCRGVKDAVLPITTEDWPTPATRPKYSALSSKKLLDIGISPMPNLQTAISEFCATLNSIK